MVDIFAAMNFTTVLGFCFVAAAIVEGAADVNTTEAEETYTNYVTLKDQRHLIQSEQQLVSHLSEYTSVLESTIESVKRFLSDVCLERDLEEHFQASKFRVFDDPVFAFENILREQRFEDDFFMVTKSVQEHEDVLKNLQKFMGKQEQALQRLPGTADLEEFSMMLSKMWLMYQWTAEDLLLDRIDTSNPKFPGNGGLEPEHILDVVEVMMKNNMFTAAVKLLGLLQDSVGNFKENSQVVRKMEHLLTTVVERHDMLVDNLPPEYLSSNPFLHLEKYGKFDPSKHSSLPAQRDIELPEISDRVAEIAAKSMLKFPKLCSQGGPKLFKDPNLKCFVKSNHNAYWTIQPQKFEVLSKDPFVVQVHDLVRDEMINTLKASELQKLKRSTVVNSDNEFVPSNERVSAAAFLSNEMEESVKWVKIIEMTTGLVTKGREAEPFQVSNYATGGHFNPHFDALFSNEELQKKIEEEDDRGDRIMTFMFYLTDVEFGGRTAFPLLDLTAEPVKGSALMWYNLRSDNSFDYRMVHSGCPVVKGTKWISLQLLRIYPQMFRLKCPPQRDLNNWFYDEFGFGH